MGNNKTPSDTFASTAGDDVEISEEFMAEVREGIKRAEAIGPAFHEFIEQAQDSGKAGVFEFDNGDGTMSSFSIIPPHCDDESLEALVDYMTDTAKS